MRIDVMYGTVQMKAEKTRDRHASMWHRVMYDTVHK